VEQLPELIFINTGDQDILNEFKCLRVYLAATATNPSDIYFQKLEVNFIH
jgi:hypothetical protein